MEFNAMLAIVAGTFLFILLSVFINAYIGIFQKRRQVHQQEVKELKRAFDETLLQSQVEVQEATLSMLSKELHDNIGQLLGSARMLLGTTERSLPQPPETLLKANETIGAALSELRALSKSLNKEWLQQFNLVENLVDEVNRLSTGDGIKLHLSPTEPLNMQPDAQLILFRIIQEAIQNGVKHANAKNMYIDISSLQEIITVAIKDDGSGFSEGGKPTGIGLLNMKHRAKILGGNIEWLSTTQGSTVLITLPIKP